MATETLTKEEKLKELLTYFDDIEIGEGEEVRLDEATIIVDVKKFIIFSQDLLKGKTFTKITNPYILRLHKLRLHYEQKRKN